jgi:hypothetical protein
MRQGKERRYLRHKRIRFARWTGKERELSMGRKGNEEEPADGPAKKGICGKYWKGRKKGRIKQ